MLEIFILSDVARDHSLDLSVFEQEAETEVFYATIVRHDRQVFDLLSI